MSAPFGKTGGLASSRPYPVILSDDTDVRSRFAAAAKPKALVCEPSTPTKDAAGDKPRLWTALPDEDWHAARVQSDIERCIRSYEVPPLAIDLPDDFDAEIQASAAAIQLPPPAAPENGLGFARGFMIGVAIVCFVWAALFVWWAL